LFELKDDCRPATERTAAGRYAEPTFFAATPARRESGDNRETISELAAVP
jgi:hypothetical protein